MQEAHEFEASKRHRLPGQDGVYQLPLVVLLCEFTRPTLSHGPAVLEWHEVLTLFHEMGHAMHCEFYLSVGGKCLISHSSFRSYDWPNGIPECGRHKMCN